MELRLAKERAYEKYAWVIPCGMGVFFLLSSIAALVSPGIFTGSKGVLVSRTGHDFSYISTSTPGVANYIFWLIRVFGFTGFGLGAFLTGVFSNALQERRRGPGI